MRKKIILIPVSIIICMIILMCSVFCAGALDDIYNIDELGLSVKIPKEYTVVTRNTDKGDSAFSELSLSYDDLEKADIYLQAMSDDKLLKVNLSANKNEDSKKINNYADLNEAQRQDALENFLTDKSYTSGVEIKRDEIIYFDFKFSRSSQSGTIYGYQCHTIVNGLFINLTLEKYTEDLTADEIRIITNIANSVDFKTINHQNNKKIEVWRFLVFVFVILFVIVLVNIFYRHFHSAKDKESQKHKEDKRSEQMSHTDLILSSQIEEEIQKESKKNLLDSLGYGEKIEIKIPESEDDESSFDQMLGYDTTDYYHRANSQIDSFDLKVKQKKRSNGVKYFEDDGANIREKEKTPQRKSKSEFKVAPKAESKNNSDYFDDFFSDKTENHPQALGSFSKVGYGIRNSFKRLSYFFINIWRMIFPSKKLKRKSKKNR